MSTSVILSVVENNNVKFDSICLLNEDLHKSGIGELLEEYPEAQFIKQSASGEFTFFERDDDGAYHNRVAVWGCFGIEEATIIASHVISGSLILQLSIEGDERDYFKIEANSAKTIVPTVTF